MKIQSLFFILFGVVGSSAFAGACYQTANCSGQALYQGRRNIDASQCLFVGSSLPTDSFRAKKPVNGGNSFRSQVDGLCYLVWNNSYIAALNESPVYAPAPVTHAGPSPDVPSNSVCRESVCYCEDGGVQVSYGDTCH